MSPEQWERLSAIYHAALARDPEARTPFVVEACGPDEALRREVLSLLATPPGDDLPGLSAVGSDRDGSGADAPGAASATSRLEGREIGPYRIVALLGVGGMGRVYRARDTTLDREVAIKTLPGSVASDPDRLARFSREARALAALNHPNIGAIHGFVTVDGAPALVLELVEGATLAERLRRGPLPAADALALADQIAQALDAAHQAGIVHRDLKPANIKVRADGVVKVLDFGLAKVVPVEPGTDVVTHDAFVSTEGLVLGTPAYMSPEQARGQTVDRRADVWAFGCVLFEMLTAHSAFGRETSSDTIAAILDDEPDWARLPASTPRGVTRVLRRCLAKPAGTRLRDIGDAQADLREAAADEDVERAAPAQDAWRRRWSAVALTAALTAGVGAAAWVAWPRATDGPELAGPPAPLRPTALVRATFDDSYVEGPAISPDGSLIAFASDRDGADNLDIWLQHAAGGSPVRVTKDGGDDRQPTFSPDGSQILFRSEAQGGGLYVVPTLGGLPRLVAPGGMRGRYSPDGTRIAYWVGNEIGFAARPAAYRTFVVRTGGGTPTEVTGFSGARYPVWSPDGRALVVAASRAASPSEATYDWWVVNLDDNDVVGTRARAVLQAAGALSEQGLVPPPHAWIGDRLLTSVAGSVWSVEVDRDTFTAGRVEQLTFGPGGASEPSVSRDGLVAFVGSTSSQAVWALPLDAEAATVGGEPRALTEGAGPYGRGAFSADGRTMAYQAARTPVSILVQDTTTRQVTDLGVRARQYGPTLSPDGTLVAFPNADGGVGIVPSGGGTVRQVCEDCEPGEWTSDSRRLAWASRRTNDIQIFDVTSGATMRPVARSAGQLNRPHFSANGRWMAFRAFDDQRGAQVFVVPLGDTAIPAGAWINISGESERDARPTGWSPGGRMVYFLSSRDGFRCLYARPWDDAAGQPRGPVQLVRHFHNLRNPGGGGASVISTGAGNAISLNRFVFDFEVTNGDVWTMRLPVGTPR